MVVWLWVGIETGWYVPVIHSIGEDVGLVVGWLRWKDIERSSVTIVVVHAAR